MIIRLQCTLLVPEGIRRFDQHGFPLPSRPLQARTRQDLGSLTEKEEHIPNGKCNPMACSPHRSGPDMMLGGLGGASE